MTTLILSDKGLDQDAFLRATTCEPTKLAVEIATGMLLSSDRSEWPQGLAVTMAKAIEAGALIGPDLDAWAASFNAYLADPLNFNKTAA